jgi:hypothetical protein
MERRAELNAGRGIDWLDSHHPNWAERVPENVDIRLGNRCVVKHMTGRMYHEGVSALLGNENPAMLGFFVSGDKYSPEVIAEYAVLTTHFQTARSNRLEVVSTHFTETAHQAEQAELATV